MDECRHEILELLPAPASKVRCRHCHLSIAEDELGGGPCPECLEATGRRRREFEPVADAGDVAPVYRCEACGLRVDG